MIYLNREKELLERIFMFEILFIANIRLLRFDAFTKVSASMFVICYRERLSSSNFVKFKMVIY